jgi:hypothetical protein
MAEAIAAPQKKLTAVPRVEKAARNGAGPTSPGSMGDRHTVVEVDRADASIDVGGNKVR